MNETAPDAYREHADKRHLPTLDDVRVASPCDVPWERMLGNGRVRRCGECAKQVFNLSAMTRADAEVLLRERTEGVCVRFYRRLDGTILTADCPVGTKAALNGKALLKAAFVAVAGFLALVGLERLTAALTTNVRTSVNSGSTQGFTCDTPATRSHHSE